MNTSTWKLMGLMVIAMSTTVLVDARPEGRKGRGSDEDRPRRPSREQILEKYDTNKDGQLSESEREQIKADHQARGERGRRGPGGFDGERPSREDILAKFDKDGDGSLNKEERAAALDARGVHHGESGGRGPGGERPNRKEMMKKFDVDGDGQLSEEERSAMREAFESRRGKRGKHGDK